MRTLLIGGGVLVAGFILWQTTGEGPYRVVDVYEARDLMAADTSVLLLDVRTPGEYHGQTGHLKGALLIPVQELEARIGELEEYRGRTILAYCRTGRRSGTAAGILADKGFTALNMAGGIVEWQRQGLPVETDGR